MKNNPIILEKAFSSIEDLLGKMSDEERLALFVRVGECYCFECGVAKEPDEAHTCGYISNDINYGDPYGYYD
jgi:hypothetical protein